MSTPILNELQTRVIQGIKNEDQVIGARCGWGSGKTSALVFAIWSISWLRPGRSSLIVTDTAMRYNSVLFPEMEKWLGPLGWIYNHTNRLWTDPNTKSSVYCRSYFRPGTKDSTHNPLEGLNITSGVVLIDECQTLKEEVAYKALGRLRSGPSPIMILVGLPVLDAWWIKLAEEADCKPLLYTSYVNQSNLSDAWFEATELLPTEERQAMVLNEPAPRHGLVYSEFNHKIHVIDDFEYNEDMHGKISIDFGFRKPSILIMVYDKDRDATIIVNEINPQEVTIEEVSRLILKVAYPRSLKSDKIKNKIWLDSGVADKAGKSRSDQTGLSAFRLIKRAPEDGGIGLPLKTTTDQQRTSIINGVQKLKRAFHSNKYFITREVWNKGDKAAGNSIRKALLSYSWSNNKEEPVKDGREDPLDALRYDCIFHYWSDSHRNYANKSKKSLISSHLNSKRKLSF
tara:strand:+ start:4254 stop:5621 length:1368 start_codon:yes stop_codon:yes gene_type:complete